MHGNARLFVPYTQGSPTLGISTWPASPAAMPHPAAKGLLQLLISRRESCFCDRQSVGNGEGSDAQSSGSSPVGGNQTVRAGAGPEVPGQLVGQTGARPSSLGLSTEDTSSLRL